MTAFSPASRVDREFGANGTKPGLIGRGMTVSLSATLPSTVYDFERHAVYDSVVADELCK